MLYFPPLLKHFDVPVGHHFGSFGARRKYSIHCGIDIYADEGTPIYAIEDGKIVEVRWFTGAHVGTDWWLPTRCVSVEGNTGVIVYGEITEMSHLEEGAEVNQSEHLGNVTRVLRHDKGKPLSMLHVQLLEHGYVDEEIPSWKLEESQPKGLLDPTEILIQCQLNQIIHHIF